MRGILLITEDARTLTPIQSALIREGYRVAVSSPDEDSLLDAVGKLTPEILIVDSRSSRQVITDSRRLLGVECSLKELLVVALLTREQAIETDWAGIDDFVLEPCSDNELLSRLRLLIWRKRNISSDQVVKIGDLLIDMLNYNISVSGVPVELTFKEYELLKFLATHRGRVFTREALLNHVWGYDYYGGTRTVDVHIRRVRAKLSPACDGLIETVRNVGYRFAA
ncbi:MAG TPA: response regulator transcription factor [Armatimonadota bacterium]|nr:response regulator transcription factor [Armatimonadota bacterium]